MGMFKAKEAEQRGFMKVIALILIIFGDYLEPRRQKLW